MIQTSYQAPLFFSTAIPIHDLYKDWGRNPPSALPLPLIILAGGPAESLTQALKKHLNGVLIEMPQPDLRGMLNVAEERNLPVILNVPPSLQEEIPNLKQRLGNRFSPLTVLLDGDERVPFDLVLKKEWNAAAIIAAVLADRGFGASALLPLELIAVHEARKQIANDTSPVPVRILEPLITALAKNCANHMKKLLPKVYDKLPANILQEALARCILKNPGVFDPLPEGAQKGYLRLLKERFMDEETYRKLSLDSREDQVLAGLDWWPFDDHRLRLPGEPDLIFATPLCTGEMSFIATIAPTDPQRLAYFWRLAEREEPGLIVSLLKEGEYPGLGSEENPLISSTLLSDFLVLNKYATGRQLHYTLWNDGKTIGPKELHFLIQQAEKYREMGRPLLVHCQVGRGRTGVFCAAYEIFAQFRKNGETPDIWPLVFQMNLQRPYMVAEMEQYKSLFEYANFLKRTS